MDDLIRLLRPDYSRHSVEVLRFHGAEVTGRGQEEPADAAHALRVVGFELQRERDFPLERLDVYRETDVLEVFVTVGRADVARQVAEHLAGLAPSRVERYGIDPDYYRCAVPLHGKLRRPIERYVLSLKNARGAGGRLKRIAKGAAVTFAAGDRLYERFLVFARKDGLRC